MQPNGRTYMLWHLGRIIIYNIPFGWVLRILAVSVFGWSEDSPCDGRQKPLKCSDSAGREGAVHLLRNHFPELKDGILRAEVATVGCGRMPQHL